MKKILVLIAAVICLIGSKSFAGEYELTGLTGPSKTDDNESQYSFSIDLTKNNKPCHYTDQIIDDSKNKVSSPLVLIASDEACTDAYTVKAYTDMYSNLTNWGTHAIIRAYDKKNNQLAEKTITLSYYYLGPVN